MSGELSKSRLRLSYEFLQSAKALSSGRHWAQHIMPRSLLCVHSIELSLKAILELNAERHNKAIKGHDLLKLWNEVLIEKPEILGSPTSEEVCKKKRYLKFWITFLNDHQNSILSRYGDDAGRAVFVEGDLILTFTKLIFLISGFNYKEIEGEVLNFPSMNLGSIDLWSFWTETDYSRY